MVAGENNNMTDEKLDSRSMPIIKSNDLEETISDFKMYIMGVKQAHLGLKAKPKLGNRKAGITDVMWLEVQEDHKRWLASCGSRGSVPRFRWCTKPAQ